MSDEDVEITTNFVFEKENFEKILTEAKDLIDNDKAKLDELLKIITNSFSGIGICFQN